MTTADKATAGANPGPAPAREPSPVMPGQPPMADTNSSIAGEEDPGAALDLSEDIATASKAGAASAAASCRPGRRAACR